jgi:hypothetical protein
VRNVGDLVEQYQFEVLGESARWAQVVPRQVSVLPHGQEEKTVEVIFRPPPPPAAPAGEIPFGVRCVSLERRDRCAVVEGDVAVGAVHNLSAQLEPVSPRGRWTGRYKVRFDNTGSVPVTLRLEATDTKQLLRFALAPRDLTVERGQSGRAYLAVRPRQPMTRGKPVEHPFVCSYRATTEGGSGELAGAFEQRPIVSKTVFALAAVVIGLAAVGGVLLLRANNGQQQKKVALNTDGPPPPTVLKSAQPLTGNSAQLVWERSPYATGYVVQQVQPDGTVAGAQEVKEPDQTTVAWPGLKPGKTCFQVLTVGKSGRSAPSGQQCVTLAAPAPKTAPSPTQATPTTTQPTSAPPGGGGPGPGGPGGPGGTGGPSDPGNGGTGGSVVLQGYIAIYATVPQDDTASQGTAQGIVTRLQQAGAQALLLDSNNSKQLTPGQWYVVQDGFDTFAAALAECNQRRSIPGAKDCYAQQPLA